MCGELRPRRADAHRGETIAAIGVSDYFLTRRSNCVVVNLEWSEENGGVVEVASPPIAEVRGAAAGLESFVLRPPPMGPRYAA